MLGPGSPVGEKGKKRGQISAREASRAVACFITPITRPCLLWNLRNTLLAIVQFEKKPSDTYTFSIF